MNIRKITLVVESTRKIFCYSLISKFKHIFIELFTIGYKNKKKKKKNQAFLNKKDILKIIN